MVSLDYTHVMPMTVQCILSDHLEAIGVPKNRIKKIIEATASEMSSWGYEVVSIQNDDSETPSCGYHVEED